MTKQKISSKVVRARSLAIYELDQFIDYIHIVDPKLNIDQAIVLAAFALHDLPQLFQINPELLNRLKEIAQEIRKKGSECDRLTLVNGVRSSGDVNQT
ncbi:MAG: hypothetical protein HWQ41_19310 [Nostoc sp. NOS(2021)]|uniref:hypothetical protein n=1 Tax=Nostoc sp. NOS(2021) TaxID=2815407 RepID=UPI0025D7970D|nr:hypothetical protein [Nostoc sp. NOS(2021)]MBN3897344.1 hypothetical protein [Nostoc sp. NOS(2021)]